MNDVIVEVVGQQWFRQLSQEALQHCCGNVHIVQLSKVHLYTCNEQSTTRPSSSSSSRNEYYLGVIITLLLQDHCTMSTPLLTYNICCIVS